MGNVNFYFPSMYCAERELAQLIKRLNNAATDRISPVLDGLKADQPKAVENACTKPLSILRGRAGTGKTTTIANIVKSYSDAGLEGVVFGPTGKAAKRAAEVMILSGVSNPPECSTAHAGLGWGNDGPYYTHRNTLDVDYVIFDEHPMADLAINHAVFSAIDPSRTRVVLCGDTNQLMSVGSGNVAHDLISSGIISETYLDVLFRQGANSGIAYNAGQILKGESISKKDPRNGELFKDFFFSPRASAEETFSYIMECATEKIPAKRGLDPIKDIQVLGPGKKGVTGTKKLNDELRACLNPKNPKVADGWQGFRKGDKVINKKNNYQLGIVNGDVGFVKHAGKKGMTVDFGTGAGIDGKGIVEIKDGETVSIYLAYAFTIHSSQGSEFTVGITPIENEHWIQLNRNLLYTAVTRPKQLELVVGNPTALERAIDTTVVDKRITGLQKWLAC